MQVNDTNTISFKVTRSSYGQMYVSGDFAAHKKIDYEFYFVEPMGFAIENDYYIFYFMAHQTEDSGETDKIFKVYYSP